MFKHMQEAMHQAMLSGKALSTDTRMSTDVRTDSRRTGCADQVSHLASRARGGSTNLVCVDGISPLGAELAALVPALQAKPQRHPVRRTKRTEERAPIPRDDRIYVYLRDGFKCNWCSATEHLTLDHITPWSAGGSDHVDNLLTLCWTCNEHRSNFRHIDDSWRPLPLTYYCEHCDVTDPRDALRTEHPSVCPCFCWWCKKPGLGSRAEWFTENPDVFWDFDLRWHRPKPPGYTAQLWEEWIARKRNPWYYDLADGFSVPWEHLNLDLTDLNLVEVAHA